jgi:hypothetical protein
VPTIEAVGFVGDFLKIYLPFNRCRYES